MNILKKIKILLLTILAFEATGAYAQYSPRSVRDQIYELAALGNIDQLNRLLSMGYSLEMVDSYGNTPYCEAVWAQNRTAAATLAMLGANVNAGCLSQIRSVTELQIYKAAHREDLKQLVAWKKEGINIDVEDKESRNSALCEAVYRSDCPAIQTLLRAGAKQGQPCMRRIPKEVRERLNCRPLKIDWATIGYTTLGIGMAGGLIALFGGHGGNGTPVCHADERWNGERCMTCATCWVGNYCVTQSEQTANYYYRDEVTGECWTVAPPPRKLTGEELASKKAEIEADEAYTKGGFLDSLEASTAYARGYTGYMVERKQPWGRLTHGQVGPDEAMTSVSKEKVKVAVISSGMNIGNGGVIQETSSGSSTANTIKVWNWDRVNKSFYDSSTTGQLTYTPYGGSGGQVVATNGSKLGETDTNLALKADGSPYGYNFDFGFCQGDASSASGWDQCFGPVKTVDGTAVTSGAIGDAEFLAEDCNDKTGDEKKCWPRYLLGFYMNKTVDGVFQVADTSMLMQKVKWEACTEEKQAEGKCISYAEWRSLYTALSTEYIWDTGYVYNLDNPDVHYSSASTEEWNRGNEGTFLAGVIAAMKGQGEMYGIAYNGSILPINSGLIYNPMKQIMETIANENVQVALLNDTLRTTWKKTGGARNDALGAFTIGTDGSYSSKVMADVYGDTFKNAFNTAISKNVVIVLPTGNESRGTVSYDQPGLYTAIPLTSTYNSVDGTTSKTWAANELPTLSDTNKLKNLFIVATSVKTTVSGGTVSVTGLADGAQPCGITGSYCLSAPGGTTSTTSGGVYSTLNPTSDNTSVYGTFGGTGIAAAQVAGSVALLMGAYPHLTPQQAVAILFNTATYVPASGSIEDEDDLGKYNSVYGRGLVNLARATEPVGGKEGLWVYKEGTAVGAASGVVTASSTRIISSASITPNLTSGLPNSFVGFDYYNRPFTLPTKALFVQQKHRKSKSLNDFKLFMKGRDPIKIETSENFSMMYRDAVSQRARAKAPMGLMEMKFKQKKMTYSLFYTEDTQNGRQEYWKRRQSNPFVQMHNAYGLETGYQLNSKWSVEAGWIMGKNGFYDDTDSKFVAPDNKMQAFTTSIVFKPIDKLSFKVATGVMKETGSSLGMISSGAFNIKGANTYYAGAGVVLSPMDKIRLEAMYYYGQTHTHQGEGLTNLSNLTSDSFAVTASYEPTENHLFGFQVSSPLRVKSGTLNVSLPVGRHPTEDIYYYDTYKMDMKPKAREIDLSMYYQGQLKENISVQSEVGVRLHPDHQAEAVPDYRGMLGLKWNY